MKTSKKQPTKVDVVVDREEMTDEQIDQEIADKKAAQKPRGRPKNSNYLTWDEAREFMRDQMLPSRGKFFEWWEREKPKAVPRFPYRVYTDEWTSWNDFLGTNNQFNSKIGIKWRPFMEAVGWAIKQGLKNQSEWLEFCKLEDKLPSDIPARPDVVYKEWRSWGHWLGSKPVEAVQTRQEVARSVQVFYIVHEGDAPQNVLSFGIEPNGLTVMKQRWEEEQFTIVRLFWYDPEKANMVKHIIDSLSTSYQGYERQRIVPNVWEIVYYLQMHLEQITAKDVK